ncbi:MAG: rod shape-determining protein MreC [Myxococcota bacterium]
MPELLRRFRYLLTYLLLAWLCVIRLAASSTPQELPLPARLLLEISVPVERMVALPVTTVRDVWRGYLALVSVNKQNRDLRSRIAELEDENLQYREAIVASERFRRLRHLHERNDLPMVPATVIAQDLSPWFRSVIINRGKSVGITTGMPVVADDGLVGIVAGTTRNASSVMLLIDPQSRVDVYVQRTRARGTVRGRSADTCGFEYVLRDEDVQAGDLLLTSGLDRLYPKGFPVGRLSNLHRKPYGLFLSADLEPSVDFRRLEEVFVILDRREIPPADAFKTDHDRLFPVSAQR